MESKSDAAMNQSNVEGNLTSMSSIYFKVFSFEEKFSPEKSRAWMLENWTSAFYFCAAYVFLVFSIKWCMRNRPSYKLRKGLIAWNAMLATFSTMGAIRSLSEFYYVMSNYGLYHSVCYSSIIEPDKVFGFWSWVFALSKLLEFGDTMFIVLRKQELKFLHWYHHITVLLYTWPAYSLNCSTTRWFMTMNYSVHSIMYTYYMLRAIGFSLPRSLMIFITTLQILQMVFGCLNNYWAYMYTLAGQYCQVSGTMVMWGSLMYFSYLILFSHFFYVAYLSPDRRKKPSSIKDNRMKSQ